MDVEQDKQSPNHSERRPYQPPDVDESARFETLALGCDFADPDPITGCGFGTVGST